MATLQFLIMQQDNYTTHEDGVHHQNCCKEFLETLYKNFINEKFMFIYHDKETDLHLHCILCLSKAMTKKELLVYFPYADVRVQRASNEQARKYLCHKTKKAIQEGKFQYDEKDIIYNNFEDIEEWLLIKKIDYRETMENEILDCIVEDILNEDIKDFKDCLAKYKGVALKYSRSIKDLLDNL